MADQRVRREVTYCAECRGVATQRVSRIYGAGDYGTRATYGLCDEHAAELVRTTDLRYTIEPLPRGRPRRKVEGEQQCLDVD